jgi:hypothetical protein
MNNDLLVKQLAGFDVVVRALGLNSYSCTYKHVATTYIAFNIDDAYDIFIEAINDKRSIVFRLLKGGN